MFERATQPDHPERCQAVNNKGQCPNLGLRRENGEGRFEYCLAHGGNKQREAAQRAGLRNYRLTKWNARLQQFGDAPEIKSLRDEIGILRLLMEQRLEKCKDAQDLILQSAPISDLVMKIDKVVTSCHKLEGSMGQLLDKQAILQFAQQVIGIVGDEVQDEDQLARIANKIVEALGEPEST